MAEKIREFIRQAGLIPVVGPLLMLLWSRKAVVAALFTVLVIRGVKYFFAALDIPEEVASSVEMLVAEIVLQVVGSALVWVAYILGVAIEDAGKASH
jgi:hypothetical protein